MLKIISQVDCDAFVQSRKYFSKIETLYLSPVALILILLHHTAYYTTQPDSLLSKGHLVMFQRVLLQGQPVLCVRLHTSVLKKNGKGL